MVGFVPHVSRYSQRVQNASRFVEELLHNGPRRIALNKSVVAVNVTCVFGIRYECKQNTSYSLGRNEKQFVDCTSNVVSFSVFGLPPGIVLKQERGSWRIHGWALEGVFTAPGLFSVEMVANQWFPSIESDGKSVSTLVSVWRQCFTLCAYVVNESKVSQLRNELADESELRGRYDEMESLRSALNDELGIEERDGFLPVFAEHPGYYCSIWTAKLGAVSSVCFLPKSGLCVFLSDRFSAVSFQEQSASLRVERVKGGVDYLICRGGLILARPDSTDIVVLASNQQCNLTVIRGSILT